MEKTIVRRAVDSSAVADLANLHPVLQRIYVARGIDSSQALERGLEHLLPFQDLRGIDQAAARLWQALRAQQRIIVIGDFDTDGATSTALAVSALQTFGAQFVHYLVPNRFEYGYGLTPEIVAVAQRWQPDLIITVDNGIASCEGVAAAKAAGIDVIVTDHHLPGDTLPAADAIVNPNQPGCAFRSKALAGVGVIFYVMLALRAKLREAHWFGEQQIAEPNMGQFLDLVALGTVADVVPLDRNNRIMVHQGLARIQQGKLRPGLQALLAVANRNPGTMVAADFGFAVAPRLNAAGRLDDMSLGIECLLCRDPHKALRMAQQLDELNQERRQIEAEMQQQAMTEVRRIQSQQAAARLPYALCLFEESWHQGVIGIVAGRIKEHFHRPVIAFAAVDNDELKGSARSIPGLHIRDALDNLAKRHPALITKFGGHAMAAGLSIQRENFTAFAAAFAAEVERLLTENDLQGVLYSDGDLALADVNMNLALLLRQAGPWGQAFPEPLFDGEFRLVDQRLLAGKHLKMVLAHAEDNDRLFDAIAFNVNVQQWPNYHCRRVLIAYRLDINHYKGQQNLQLIVEHLQALA